MKTPTLLLGFKTLCSLATALLMACYGNAATSDDAPIRSVKNLKLGVSANGRYFVDQGGKPFFYLADMCWLLFQRPNREEVDEYLKDRAAKGFTVIQAYVLRGLGKKHPELVEWSGGATGLDQWLPVCLPFRALWQMAIRSCPRFLHPL